MKAFMNWDPANVNWTKPSLKPLRNCTGSASSDPYAAEAMTHCLVGAAGEDVTVVVVVIITVEVDVEPVVIVVRAVLVDVEVIEDTDIMVTVVE